jgi:hypothetical protein
MALPLPLFTQVPRMGILRSSRPEVATTSRGVCSLALLRYWLTEAKVTEGGPGGLG